MADYLENTTEILDANNEDYQKQKRKVFLTLCSLD